MRLLFASILACGATLAQTQAPAPKPKDPLVAFSESTEAMARRVAPAVVEVFVSGYRPAASPDGQSAGMVVREQGSGSGVIVDPSGYIITNHHVIEGANRVRVLLQSNGAVTGARKSNALLPATVVGSDKITDLAVLKIDRGKLPYLRLEDSDLLKQGQVVFAMGSPMGLANSLSMGIVSSVSRQIRPDDTMIYIQTDASINPGNSGGPLLDVHGRVVGINTFIFTQSGGNEGLGFSVPSNIVRSIYQQIRKQGHVHRGVIGAAVQTITPVLAMSLGLPVDRGVIVADVAPEGPAEKAGVKAGDIVLAMEGRPLENARQFDVGVFRHVMEGKVAVTVLRAGEKLSLTVAVLESPDEMQEFAARVSVEKNRVPRLSMLGLTIDKDVAPMLEDVRSSYGVVVVAKTFDPLIKDVGLEPGDIVTAVNDTPITSLEALRAAMQSFKEGDAVALRVERNGRYRWLAFEFE